MDELEDRLSRALSEEATAFGGSIRDGWGVIERRLDARTRRRRRLVPMLAAAAVIAVGTATGIGLSLAHSGAPPAAAVSGATPGPVSRVIGTTPPPECGGPGVRVGGSVRSDNGHITINEPSHPGTLVCLFDGGAWYVPLEAQQAGAFRGIYLTWTDTTLVLWGALGPNIDSVRIITSAGTYNLGRSMSGGAMDAAFGPGVDEMPGTFFIHPVNGFGQPTDITVQALHDGTIIEEVTIRN